MSRIFVFGSNMAGAHAGGAARFALEERGAVWGQGIGLQGQSYALPTMDANLETLSYERMRESVDRFLALARSRDDLRFEVTSVGCGIAGMDENIVKTFFAAAPSNCELPDGWRS